jgi:hypothetical protein
MGIPLLKHCPITGNWGSVTLKAQLTTYTHKNGCERLVYKPHLHGRSFAILTIRAKEEGFPCQEEADKDPRQDPIWGLGSSKITFLGDSRRYLRNAVTHPNVLYHPPPPSLSTESAGICWDCINWFCWCWSIKIRPTNIMCVYCSMLKRNRVGRSGLFFFYFAI